MVDHAGLLKKVTIRLFPEREKRQLVTEILNRYGGASWQPEECRVRLAILKLAGTNPELIQYYTVQACRDYRDVIAMAEYPNQMANPYLMRNDPERAKDLVKEDLKQFKDWYLGILWGREDKAAD